MATESGPDQLEETWDIIVSHVMKEGDATTDTTVRSAVLNSLKQRGSLIIDILKSKTKTFEIVKTIQELDRYEQRWNMNDNTALSKDQESICLSMSQLNSLRQNMAIVRDLPWRNPHFQQLIPEDDQTSIEEKPTTVEKDIKRYQFLIGLPENFFFDKIFPTLEELDFKDLSLNLQKILNVEDTGQQLTFQDVMNIVNLRKISFVLFTRGVIQETELADLCSNSTRRETKLEILNYIGWDSLLSALKETYPHYHSALKFGTPSSLEHSDDNSGSFQLTDEPLPKHGLPKENSRSYRQRHEWCICMECREMSTEEDQTCCKQRDCLSKERLMGLIFLGAGSFKRHFMPKETLAERHRCVRQIIYKQLSVWTDNRLGPGVRKPIPNCCIWKVRRKFPDPKGKYNGFKKSRIERSLENTID